MLASCVHFVLHNFLRTKTSSKNIYASPEFIDREINGTVVEAEWRQNAGNGNILANILQQGGNRSTLEAKEIRDELCEYFNTDGQVPWQWNAI